MSKIDNERVRACILQLKEDLIKADDELESIMDPEYLNNNMLDIHDLCSDMLVSLDTTYHFRFKEELPIGGDIHQRMNKCPKI